MIRQLIIFSTALFLIFTFSEALECYHCYSDSNRESFGMKGSEYVECNYNDMSASNTWVCPHPNATCTFQKVEVSQQRQTWRSCSNGFTDPCDPKFLPPNTKLLDCKVCSTDKCNLMSEEKNSTFTFNVNANINLYIRQ